MTALPATVPQLSLPTVLDRVALAMRDLGEMIVAVETSILDEAYAKGQKTSVPMQVQQIDHILQLVEELAQLMQKLAVHQLPEVQCPYDELVSPIRIERLRNLIASGKPVEDTQQGTFRSGHISLF